MIAAVKMLIVKNGGSCYCHIRKKKSEVLKMIFSDFRYL